MDESRLRGALLAIKGVKIPDMPKEIMELDAAISSKFPNTQEITRIIESNTKLSGEVLRVVNSPIMKPKFYISSIRDAVDNMGLTNLKNMVIAAALQNMFKTSEVQEIIEHSTETAFCCAELSEHIHGITRDEAYLIGLFHNGGCLLLASKYPETYLKVFSQLNTNPISGLHKEFELYGTTHTDIGVLLGQKWKLPVEMLNTILLHHVEEVKVGREKVRAMIAMIQVANCVVNEVSYGSYVTQESKTILAMSQEELMLSNDVVNEVRRALIAFG